jgi:hypothetical protein
MDFVCYTDWTALPESADALFDKASVESIFFSRPWFENLVNTVLAENQKMLLACVVDNDNVSAILPLRQDSDGQIAPLTHLYSSLYTLLLSDPEDEKTLLCLVNGLNQLPTTAIQFNPVAEQDPNIEQLKTIMQQQGYQQHENFRFYNWIHRVKGETFAQYMADRPPRVRNTIARKQRKLAREHRYVIRLFINDDLNSNLDQALADYQRVYQASWKAKELFDGFIEGLARALAKHGWLRLAILYIDDKPAAAQFWFVVHGKASIFKLAYDEAWKQYSPGSILIHYLMQHVIEVDQVDEIDFLTGNDAYKQDWMSERRQRKAVYFGKPQRDQNHSGKFFSYLKKRLTKAF